MISIFRCVSIDEDLFWDGAWKACPGSICFYLGVDAEVSTLTWMYFFIYLFFSNIFLAFYGFIHGTAEDIKRKQGESNPGPLQSFGTWDARSTHWAKWCPRWMYFEPDSLCFCGFSRPLRMREDTTSVICCPLWRSAAWLISTTFSTSVCPSTSGRRSTWGLEKSKTSDLL